MNLKIKYFGRIAEITGLEEEVIFCQNHNSESIDSLLLEKYPELKTLAYKLAIDQQIISSNQVLNENSSIALLPPFAGG